ncbi:MAG: phosphoserine phosphatase SerB [Rikenellaceae bacterium]
MRNAVEVIQVNIVGDDKPGVTSKLMTILGQYEAFVLDIGQSNIHHSLTLGILFQTTAAKSGDIMKELLFKASELGVSIRFSPISEDHYNEWVSCQGRDRYIVTLLGRRITASNLAKVSAAIAEQGLNIDDIVRLTGRVPFAENARAPKSCIEFSLRGTIPDRELLQQRFLSLSKDGVDVSFQEDDIYRRCRRLICFDMDSTLIETEVIDELAELAGVGDEVRAITESAMRGEIDFCESFTQRVAMLKGLDVKVMDALCDRLPITEGVERMMTILKRVGFKTAILSGGFTYFGNYLKRRFGFDYVYANELEIENGVLTGRHMGQIVDGTRKAELLRLLCQFEGINIAQSIAVGDGANDLPMLNIAGLGIAFHAKPKVKETAKQSISTIGLDGILYFVGLKDSWIDERM